MFIKLGELQQIEGIVDSESAIPLVSEEVLERFRKFASNLKKIAPKADDFLYFSAIMMHAAESAGINEDGTAKLNRSGENVKVGWDKSNDTWKWITNDSSIKPYKNSNGDIFPEEELIKAYKKWIHKPLCIDHKSSSVDHVRGFIVDTHYDYKLKRVVALCALDKKNYPDLARKISTGYSNSVSMGTAVGRAVCTEDHCHRVARTEKDFCEHMKSKSCYGEINIDLNPIELSIVVNGADPQAKIKHIIAAAQTLNSYLETREKELEKFSENTELKGEEEISEGLKRLQSDYNSLFEKFESFKNISKDTNDMASQSSGSVEMMESEEPGIDFSIQPPPDKFATNNSGLINELKEVANSIEVKLAHMKQNLNKLVNDSNKKQEETMAADNLNKRAYYQGTEDPTPGQPTYAKEPLNEKLRTSGDKHMDADDTGPVDGMYPGDLEKKKMLARAEAENRAMRRQAIVSAAQDGLRRKAQNVDLPEDREKGLRVKLKSAEMALRNFRLVDEADRLNIFNRPGLDLMAVWDRVSSTVEMIELSAQSKKAKLPQEFYFLKNYLGIRGGSGSAKNMADDGLAAQAYYQGTEEPVAFGKQQYPVDKLQDQLRVKEDKHMTGQKPFPGVGSVDGLHPSPSSSDTSDELKRKQMLLRAGLKARFTKAINGDGSHNKGKSAWQVFNNNKLLLTASVDSLTDNKAELFYPSVATEVFGKTLLEQVKAQGAGKVASLYKLAQTTPPAAPAADMGAPADMPMGDGPVEDTGKEGDPKLTALELSEKIRDLSSDLVEAVRALTGEKSEMGEMPAPGGEAPMAASASFSTKALQGMRVELNSTLTSAMKEAVAQLNNHVSELDMIHNMYDKGSVTESNKEFVGSIVDDALSEAKSAVADGFKLMSAFVKYARGTKAIIKRAEMENELRSLAQEEMSMDDNDLMDLVNDNDGGDLLEVDDVPDPNAPKLPLTDANKLKPPPPQPGQPTPTPVPPFKEGQLVEVGHADDGDFVDDNASDDSNDDMDLSTKAGRSQYRAKLASDALKVSPMLGEAHPKGGFTTDLDVKPSDDLAKVEDLEEQHDAMMDLANAPPKVRKEAAAINKLIKEGKLDPSDLDELVANGLDKDAVSYYKKYFSQTDGGSEFASELVKEHVKAKLEEELNVWKLKMARAYELANDMVDRGLVASERTAISKQVDELMRFSDENFESVKKVVGKHPTLTKEAGRLPQVGLIGSGDITAMASAEDGNLFDQLTNALSKTTKRVF